MKHFLAALCVFGGLVSASAQTTWNLGTTVLTETDLATGISIPWEILWGPDDHIWCSTRTGSVLRIDPATGIYTELLDISVLGGGSGEGGMLGMVLHPDFANSPYVFIVYCTGSGWSGTEVLARYTWNGTALIDETIILDNLEAGGIHNGSRLLVLPDNTLLMTTGDVGDGGVSSQNSNSLMGKTLRLNLDGTIPADNPDPTSYVYSMGHRNAQGLCLGPDGIIYSSEHGQSQWDEFNIIEPDRNYGWPNVEGPCDQGNEQAFCDNNNVKEPIWTWSPCVAVNGMIYYDHPAIPEWNNSVLIAVLGGLSGLYERLSVMHMSEDGLTVESEDQWFSEWNERIRDVCVNPHDGTVYLALNGASYPGSGPNKIKQLTNVAYVGVDEAQSQPAVTAFPNPADEVVNISVEAQLAGGRVEVIGFNGQLVYEGTMNGNEIRLDATTWNAGTYFVRISNESGTATRTFVVN